MVSESLHQLILRESRCYSGFAWVPLDELWADIALMRTWDACEDLPASGRELRQQVRELAGKGLVEIDGERVKAGAVRVVEGLVIPVFREPEVVKEPQQQELFA